MQFNGARLGSRDTSDKLQEFSSAEAGVSHLVYMQ